MRDGGCSRWSPRRADVLQGWCSVSASATCRFCIPSSIRVASVLYVAISRFRRADHLLILQPFDIDVLQQGEPAQAAFLLEHLQLMATQNQDEARQRAEAYGAQVRAQRASKRTADRRLSENLSEETRDAQRQRLEENVGDMSAEARERQQSANEKRKSTNRMTARCGECGEHKISDEYTRRQWQDRKKRTPTCRKCTMIAEAQSKSQQRPLRRSRRAQ